MPVRINRLSGLMASLLAGLVLMTTALVAAPVQAQDAQTEPVEAADVIEPGVAAVRRGDFAEAYCLWRPLAEQGDTAAQFQLGWLYANGEGLRQNPATAADWWERAARNGNADAELALAQAYRNGRGRKKDLQEAVHWLLVASRNGNDEAQAILRSMAGSGVEPAVAEVARLLRDGGWQVIGGVATINADSANLREKPRLSAKLIGSLNKGDTVIVLLRKEKWLRIGVVGSDRLAWVYARLVTWSQ